MGELKFQKDEELSQLVASFVVARDDAGEDPPAGDFTEGGFTDFDYVGADLEPHELIQVGMNITQEAAGREVWYTFDGVGYRIFFGPLEEVKERVRKLILALEVQTA